MKEDITIAMDIYTISRGAIVCIACDSIVDHEADTEEQVEAMMRKHTKKWKYAYSKTFNTSGWVCPECLANKSLDWVVQ